MGNGRGQLGIGNATNYGETYLRNGDVYGTLSLPMGRSMSDMCLGNEFTCVLQDNGNVACFGRGDSGQLGVGANAQYGDSASEVGDNTINVLLGTGKTATKLSCSDSQACAIVSDGTVKCWGLGTAGRLGNGSISNLGLTPGEIPSVDLGTTVTPVELAVGGAHSCVILHDSNDNKNKIKCWGSNSSGQLGYNHLNDLGDGPNEMGNNLPFVDFGIAAEPTKVWAGNSHSCAQFTTGNIKCWGSSNRNGTSTSNLGDSGTEMLSLPDISFGAGLTIQSFAATETGGCAIVVDGSANKTYRCFGNNTYGLLGIGTGTATLASATSAIDFGPGFTPVNLSKTAGSGNINCAVVNGGGNNEVKCWGRNDFGQIAQGTNLVGDSAVDMGTNLLAINNLGTYAATPLVGQDVSVGSHFMCIMTTAGVAKCMGNNASGQLGTNGAATNFGDDSTEIWSTHPIVSGATTIIQLQAQGSNTCALYSDYTLHCWGNGGARHALTIGSTFKVPQSAMNFGANRRVLNFFIGQNAMCVLLDNLLVKCLGTNASGLLGGNQALTEVIGDDPAEIGDNIPYVPLGLTSGSVPYTAKAITVSNGNSTGSANHACAILHTNELKCWGNNNAGQLGINSNTNQLLASSAPVAIVAKNFVKVTAGTGHTCAIFSDKTSKCWGENSNGQHGYAHNNGKGFNTGTSSMATVADHNWGGGATAVDIQATHNSNTGGITCALLDNGKIKCVGNNYWGTLGSGDITYWNNPSALSGIDFGW